MRTYRIRINWTGGMEVIDVEAKEALDAIAKVLKQLKAKQKITGYRPLRSIEIVED